MEPIERKIILENAIAHYVRHGYRVNSQTENSVQLIRPKQFSLLVAIILLLLFFLPFVLYFLYYLAQIDKTVYLVISEEGKISVTDEVGRVRVFDNPAQLAPITIQSVPADKDPGYTTSTKIMLAVVAIVMIIIFIASLMNN